MEQAGCFPGIYLPFFQKGHSQEVPVQDKQGAPEMLRCAETVTAASVPHGRQIHPQVIH